MQAEISISISKIDSDHIQIAHYCLPGTPRIPEHVILKIANEKRYIPDNVEIGYTHSSPYADYYTIRIR